MSNPKNDRKRSHPESAQAVSASHAGGEKASKRVRVDERRSIFIRSLPPSATNETLADFFSQHFPVKHAVVVADQKTKESRGYGFVTFADVEDATEAKKSLDKKEWDGRRIRVEVAEPRHRTAASGPGVTPPGKPDKDQFQRPPKLIVRNLPWSVKTSDQLSQLFRSFGKVKFADLPQSKGKLKGFGFVTIRGKKNAEKALETINGKEIDGRTLAVDWAVDKETWDEQQGSSKNKDAGAGQDEDESDEEVDDEDDEEDEGGVDIGVMDLDASSKVPSQNKKKKASDSELDADLENFFKNHMQNLEDENDDEDEDERNNESGMEKTQKGDTTKHVAVKRMTDNSSTVFIRNLPFTATDEQLKSFFAHFGSIRYARVVIDKATDKPAGTAFVCFFNGEEAKSCIRGAPRPATTGAGTKHSILQDENADPSGRYTLDGRLLQVAQAVNKEEASVLADNALGKRREGDKRRLYLLPEGAIGRGNPLFDLLAPSEIQMRQASAAQRKKLVQTNPTLHVSLTRLALRNIPRSFGSKELKELARKAVVGFATEVREGRRQPLSKEENARDGKDAKEKDQERRQKGKGIVRQAKIVFESNQGSKIPEKDGAGKSRGYGFIEYTSHHWALMGLRFLNGHQVEDDIGKKQRLVVEFAIENAQVVQRRRAAEEKSGQGPQPKKDSKTSVTDRHDAGTTAKGKRNATSNKKDRGKKGPSSSDGGGGDRQAAGDENSNAATGKDDMKQKLIARTRLMRKKKAKARGGKK